MIRCKARSAVDTLGLRNYSTPLLFPTKYRSFGNAADLWSIQGYRVDVGGHSTSTSVRTTIQVRK